MLSMHQTRSRDALLGPCYKTGPAHFCVGFVPGNFTSFDSPCGVLFNLPSQYLCAIGLPEYLVFDGRCHRFTLYYKTELLLVMTLLGYGPITLYGCTFQHIRRPTPAIQLGCPITIWTFSCSLAATTEILVSFFSSR